MEWTLTRDNGQLYHECEHGTMHPNRGSAALVAVSNVTSFEEWQLRHGIGEDGEPLDPTASPPEVLLHSEDELRAGYEKALLHVCDGCCERDDFPGQAGLTLQAMIDEYSLDIMQKLAFRYPKIGYALLAFKLDD